MSDLILQTKNLSKEFKGYTALKDVNLAVRRGHIHALIGPNGAGNHLVQFAEQVSGAQFGPDFVQWRRYQPRPSGANRAHGRDPLVSDFGRVCAFDGAAECAHRPAASARHFVLFLAKRTRLVTPE